MPSAHPTGSRATRSPNTALKGSPPCIVLAPLLQGPKPPASFALGPPGMQHRSRGSREITSKATHLQEPVSSTTLWDTEAEEGERPWGEEERDAEKDSSVTYHALTVSLSKHRQPKRQFDSEEAIMPTRSSDGTTSQTANPIPNCETTLA